MGCAAWLERGPREFPMAIKLFRVLSGAVVMLVYVWFFPFKDFF